MARLTVSYSIAFIPGLPRPLDLSEVIDDVLGLSSLSSQHTVHKRPGEPDRLDITMPVEDLPTALDAAAKAADELTRIGESLLGLGFVVEERAIHIDGLPDNWVPDTFDGAGTRHHAPTALDAAAPLPDELNDPLGELSDEDLRLDNLHTFPAADVELPRDLLAATEPFAAEGDAAPPGRVETHDLLATARAHREGHDPVGRSLRDHRHTVARPPEPGTALRRRDLARQAVAPPPAAGDGGARVGVHELRAYALFAVGLVAVVAPWRLSVSTASIVALAVGAAALAAGSAIVWPDARSFTGRIALTGTVTLAFVLAFASAYAICADEGDLRGTGNGAATVGQSLSGAVSLGASSGLSLGPGAHAVAYAERLLVLLALVGAGAHVVRTAPARSARRDTR
ncbi:MAG TPA: hypothetical protein VFG42_20895 [Baekduia sp.]|uniref:hypothetical protein n=1 Tax=Baekduia sp. TaxID=2600305 RepID=UPI002D795BD9|nr:hypothetical protein [Baekduia sp.]HET6509267.1 hypothetical protein [Baekduia sp.]